MTLDARLLELLVCPLCKGPLTAVRANGMLSALACRADRLAYPVRDGMPVMLENEALSYDPDTGSVAPVPPAPPQGAASPAA